LTGLPKAESVIDGFIITLSHLGSINRYAFVLFAVTLASLLIWKRFIKSIPGILPISVIGILIGYLSSNGYIAYPIVTLAQDMVTKQFPALVFQLVDLSLFSIWLPKLTDISFVSNLLIAGFTISIVAILETIISAKIADKMTKTKFQQEKEVF
jgi:MFS superfamily sulfate permease-like transporter